MENRHDRDCRSLAPMGLDELLEEAIPLIAEDIRAARTEMRITSAGAAKRAGLAVARYRALEKGNIRRTSYNAAELVSMARSLRLKSVRASYVAEVRQYMRLDLSTDGPMTVFVDALETDVAQLKQQGYFVSPYRVLALFERIGFHSTFESRRSGDKQLVELWIAAVFTLCLGGDRDYYVRGRVGPGNYTPSLS